VRLVFSFYSPFRIVIVKVTLTITILNGE